jgi:hypothetical protein
MAKAANTKTAYKFALEENRSLVKSHDKTGLYKGLIDL